ncbi:hypothetical protein GGS23DRAFT_337283 [Durotheca rogersii]|uniref:uncharacterized protein n=1 Tax=Durotheca rogersii TaxID=419775 RepID=UPI00221F4652|nr:uncharacterized protein GGS23DRAFT_337283 [Durotheca rogersii]KAI5858210.1 hypothetical protein GGS23DRAFT_337283 [Durotheca rogersii]
MQGGRERGDWCVPGTGIGIGIRCRGMWCWEMPEGRCSGCQVRRKRREGLGSKRYEIYVRRPSGRIEKCSLGNVVISFAPIARSSPRQAFLGILDATQYGSFFLLAFPFHLGDAILPKTRGVSCVLDSLSRGSSIAGVGPLGFLEFEHFTILSPIWSARCILSYIYKDTYKSTTLPTVGAPPPWPKLRRLVSSSPSFSHLRNSTTNIAVRYVYRDGEKKRDV